MKKSFRHTIIVNPKIQHRIFSLVLGVAILPFILIYFGFKLYMFKTIEQIASAYPSLAPVVESLDQLYLIGFLSFLLAMAALMFLQTLFFHKIVGPLFRIERELNEMLEKDTFDKTITIRPNDMIHSFVATLNKVLEKLKQ